jgi:hypothetical protein
MTAIATNVIPDIAMKVKIGTAACAIAVAAAVPTVVANAEPAIHAPIAPVTQILADPILSPAHIAEQRLCPIPGPDCPARTPINRFSALILAAAGIFILPVVAFFTAVAIFVGVLFQIGPYGTGRG